MAKKGTDQRIIDSEAEVAAARKANTILSDMGIHDADDLGPGRLDVGLVARHLSQPEPEMDPSDMEEAQRDSQWEQQTESPEQPFQSVRQPPPTEAQATEPADPLAQLQTQLNEAQADAKRMKEQYARESERWGNERKRNAERLARLEQGGGAGGGYPQAATTYTPPAQTGYYDPRILGDADPNAPLTAAQTASLMQNMAAAFGSQLNVREQHVIDAAREMRNYDLTTNEEADLIERHGWLATLDRASQIKAMRDLVQPLRAASPQAAAPLKPQGVNLVDLARAKHLTATTFIEPSSRGSAQETDAATGYDSALSKKIAEYREAMSLRPGMTGYESGQYGENKKAERLLREINSLQRRRV